MEKFKLNNGIEVDSIGLGTYLNTGETLKNALKDAINSGYRSIDTAKYYENEEDIGSAISEMDIDREELWVTSKLWNDSHGYDKALKAFEESESKLGKVDCYMIHWPGTDPIIHTWKALERIYEEKRVKAIGVSNFFIHHLKEILAGCNIVPSVNQIEANVYLYDEELISYCRDNRILVEAWRPLMHGLDLTSDITLADLSKKYQKTPAQIALKYLVQNGIRVIPKSINQNRIAENIHIYDFTLEENDLLMLSKLNKNLRTGPHPDNFFEV